jgi:hypothetical protein
MNGTVLIQGHLALLRQSRLDLHRCLDSSAPTGSEFLVDVATSRHRHHGEDHPIGRDDHLMARNLRERVRSANLAPSTVLRAIEPRMTSVIAPSFVKPIDVDVAVVPPGSRVRT